MNRLETLAPLAFAFVCVEAMVSLLARWPYQFTGQGDPDRMAQDFVFFGTLLAPPLSLLLLFGSATLLIRRRGLVGEIANVAMIALSLAMAVGSLGEALAPSSADVPRAVQLIGGVLGAILFAALAFIASRALSERRRMAQP